MGVRIHEYIASIDACFMIRQGSNRRVLSPSVMSTFYLKRESLPRWQKRLVSWPLSSLVSDEDWALQYLYNHNYVKHTVYTYTHPLCQVLLVHHIVENLPGRQLSPPALTRGAIPPKGKFCESQVSFPQVFYYTAQASKAWAPVSDAASSKIRGSSLRRVKLPLTWGEGPCSGSSRGPSLDHRTLWTLSKTGPCIVQKSTYR